jgi:1-acyl-sn-glycerol-3-phosphate acyltransferase
MIPPHPAPHGHDPEARAGALGAYDPAYVAAHLPRLKDRIHRYFRADVLGLERLPEGPFVAVGNHSGAALMPDCFVWLGAYYAARPARPLLTLCHDAIFDAYPTAVGRWVARFGAIRAHPAIAAEALARGYAVQAYPGGDADACRSWRRRHEIVFAGRTGYVELARAAGVPIVPVASLGGHGGLLILHDGVDWARALGLHRSLRLGALPLSLSLPWGLWLGPLPGYLPLPRHISVEVLDPIDVRGDTAQVDAAVRAALQASIDRRRAGRWARRAALFQSGAPRPGAL